MKSNWIYSQTVILFTLCTLFAFSGQAKDGTGDGGGGAGFCINGKCMTMAQAGLKIKEPATTGKKVGYQLSSGLVQRVGEIYKSLPWDDSIAYQRSSTIGEVNTFQIVEKSETKKFAKALEEYRKVLKQSGLNLPEQSLTLFAFSNSQTTYLLPEFFDLDLTGQALILIHENQIRSGRDLISVLKFDVQLVAWLKAFDTNTTQDFDIFPLAFYAAELNMFDQDLIIGFAIEKLEKKIGRVLQVEDFCPGYSREFGNPGSDQYGCNPSRETLLRLADLDSRIPQLFDGFSILDTKWTQPFKSSIVGNKCSGINPGGIVFLRISRGDKSINALVRCFSSGADHDFYIKPGDSRNLWKRDASRNIMDIFRPLLND